MKAKVDPLKRRVIPFVVPLCLLFGLELCVTCEWLSRSQWVAPHHLLPFLWSSLLLNDLGSTGYRLIAGVALGTTLGILSDLSLSQFRPIDKLLSHTLRALAAVPIIIWLPFLTPYAGLGDWSKICFVSVGTFFLVHLHCCHSAREEKRAYTELTRVYESNLWQRLSYVVIPATLGEIMTGVRLSVALGWVAISYAEFSIQDPKRFGIGQYIFQSRQDGRLEEMFAGIVMLADTGSAVHLCLTFLEKRLRGWADDSMHND